MKFLIVGDVCGRPGRAAFSKYVHEIKRTNNIDVVIVNGENAAAGKGLTRTAIDELYAGGADIITSGNHIWDKKEVLQFIETEPFLIRPANYPENAPGKGYCIYPFKAKNIGVLNLSGRAFMPEMDCPFQKADIVLKEMEKECNIIILDFHAETTSEKLAMANYLDGRVNAVVGTHTHVQTADERILPNGTAYISDLGMVGPVDSILGVKKELIIEKFLTCRPVKFEIPDTACEFGAVILEVDDDSNRSKSIARVLIREGEQTIQK